MARHLREQWGQELGIYLKGEERLAGVLSLVDIRHGPTALDLELQSFLTTLGLDRLVVLTKADKVGRGKRRQMQNQVQKTLGLSRPPLVTSVESGEGRRELLDAVADLIDCWRKKDFDSDQ